MKRKRLLTGTIALAAMFALAGGATMAIETVAEEEKAAVTVQDVNYTPNILGGYGQGTLVNLIDDCGGFWADLTDSYKPYISYVDKNGNDILEFIENCGTCIAINRAKRAAEVGDMLTLKAGLEWVGKELKSDVSYIYSTAGAPFEVFAPTALTASSESVSVIEGANVSVSFATTPAYSVAPVTYSIEPADVADVTGNGLSATITGKKEGTATLTATCGGHTATVAVTVKTAKQVSSIAVTGSVSVYKGSSALDLSGLSGKKIYSDGDEAEFSVTAEMISGEYDLNTVGNYTLTVTCEGKTATVVLEVKERPALTISNLVYAPTFFGYNIALSEKSIFNVGEAPINDKSLFVIADAAGNDITNWFNFNKHQDYIFATPNNDHQDYLPEIGSTVTLKQGYVFVDAEVKADTKYICTEEGEPFEVYDPAKHDVTSLTITNAVDDNVVRVNAIKKIGWEVNEGAATTAKFSSSNTSVATVDANGNVEGVAVGTAVITVSAGSKTATYEVEVKPALETKDVEFGVSYKIWVEKGEEIKLPADFTAHAVFEEDGTGETINGRDFALTSENSEIEEISTETAGTFNTTLTVTYEEREYELEIEIEVFEVYPMEIKEVAVVDWWSYNIFIEYPNSTTNIANITDSSLIPDALKMTYTRADGTEVKCGNMILGNGNLLVSPSYYDTNQNADNWNSAPYMQEGDKITLQKGLAGYYWTGEIRNPGAESAPIAGTGMIVRECVLEEDVTYVFDGSLWVVYIPYTDLEVKSEISVQMGSSVNLGALRVPNDATEGSFTYASSDEKIVKVSSNGRITGVALGEATVTVTLNGGVAGEKVKTVKVTVTDGIVSLKFDDGALLTVNKGTEKLDLSSLNATLVYASGKTEKADLSNAEIIGYDKNTVGESEVTVKITVNGQSYQAQLSVKVQEKGGCGSVVAGWASAGVGAVAAMFAAVLGGRKRKKD